MTRVPAEESWELIRSYTFTAPEDAVTNGIRLIPNYYGKRDALITRVTLKWWSVEEGDDPADAEPYIMLRAVRITAQGRPDRRTLEELVYLPDDADKALLVALDIPTARPVVR